MVIFILAGFMPVTQLFSQVKFYTLVSERDLSYNQTFQVQYVIEGGKNIEQLKVPKMADFNTEEVFDIPNTPSLNPNTMQLVDTYSRIVILSPKRNGQLLIQGAVAVIDGKLMKSNPIKVMVRKSGWASAPGDEDNSDVIVEDESELVGGENIDEKIKKNFFLNASVNKTSCYVGEPVMAVYKA